jgi:hypothetical protein
MLAGNAALQEPSSFNSIYHRPKPVEELSIRAPQDFYARSIRHNSIRQRVDPINTGKVPS